MKRINKDFDFAGMSFNFDYWSDQADWNIDVTGNTHQAEQALEDDEFYNSVYAYVDQTFFLNSTTPII